MELILGDGINEVFPSTTGAAFVGSCVGFAGATLGSGLGDGATLSGSSFGFTLPDFFGSATSVFFPFLGCPSSFSALFLFFFNSFSLAAFFFFSSFLAVAPKILKMRIL